MSDLEAILTQSYPPPPEWWSEVAAHSDLVTSTIFPYFGGKSKIADLVWERFGNVVNYVEPYAGSLAVMRARPHAPTIETLNDYSAHICNVWRAIKWRPEETAEWSDWPVNEVDLHARHAYLVKHEPELREKLVADPEYCDPKLAGWWIWGICAWIGSGWCNEAKPTGNKLPALSDGGGSTQGIRSGFNRIRIYDVFTAISHRFRHTRITCGDAMRVLSDAITWRHGITGVFLDPPYPGDAGSTSGIYTNAKAERATFNDAFRYCVENGDNKSLRIALCYYDGTKAPAYGHEADVSTALRSLGWDIVAWKAGGGYGGQSGTNKNAARERIAFSPHCLKKAQGSLFE